MGKSDYIVHELINGRLKSNCAAVNHPSPALLPKVAEKADLPLFVIPRRAFRRGICLGFS